MRTTRGLFILLVMLALLLAACGNPALSPQQRAQNQLEQIGVTDAQFEGLAKNEDLEIDLLSFVSQDSGYTYSFDPETGNLLQIEDTDGTYPEDSQSLTNEQRLETVLDWILPWTENHLIGELQLVQHSQIGTSWHLIWEEFYQEQATGTRISVICSGQGHIRYCTIRYGSVFTRTADGEIVLTDTRPLLEEAEAIRIAHAAVEEAFAERDFTQTLLPEKTVCTLKANEDGRFYCVEVFSSIEELPYEGNYQVILDPYDGTVQEVARNN